MYLVLLILTSPVGFVPFPTVQRMKLTRSGLTRGSSDYLKGGCYWTVPGVGWQEGFADETAHCARWICAPDSRCPANCDSRCCYGLPSGELPAPENSASSCAQLPNTNTDTNDQVQHSF